MISPLTNDPMAATAQALNHNSFAPLADVHSARDTASHSACDRALKGITTVGLTKRRTDAST